MRVQHFYCLRHVICLLHSFDINVICTSKVTVICHDIFNRLCLLICHLICELLCGHNIRKAGLVTNFRHLPGNMIFNTVLWRDGLREF